MISVKFGPQYVPDKPPVYAQASRRARRRRTRRSGRPSPQRDPESVRAFLSPQQFRLYQLIWQRFMASQMAPAILDGTTRRHRRWSRRWLG